MKKFSLIIIVLWVVFAMSVSTTLAAENLADNQYSGYPTISILSVDRDTSVTFKANNLPPNDQFRVRMGEMGTRGVKGVIVDNFSTGSGGSKKISSSIPASLQGERRIAIRIESTSGSGYYAYNWFYNNTTGGGSGGTGGKPPGYSGYPTFSIQSVVRNQTVTIKTKNLPPDDEFKTLMNYMGTRGVNGHNVGSFESGDGGTETFTFDIPSSLKGQYKIAIRFQSKTGSGYYAYNWFYNNTTP